MTQLETLKQQAYNIAAESNYCIDVKNEAMRNFALLTIAEAISNKKEEK